LSESVRKLVNFDKFYTYILKNYNYALLIVAVRLKKIEEPETGKRLFCNPAFIKIELFLKKK